MHESKSDNPLNPLRPEFLCATRNFSALLENSQDLIILTSRKGLILYVSPSLTSTFGYAAEELINKPVFMLMVQEDGERVKLDRIQIINSPGKTFTRHIRFIDKNNNCIWCEGSVTNLLHEHGINAVVSTFRVVTDQKITAQRLLREEKRFREFFENAPEGIILLDIDSMRFTDFNLCAVNLLQYSSEQLLKLGPKDLSPEFQPDGRNSEEKAFEFINRTLEGENLVAEWLVLTGNGEERLFEIRMTTLKNEIKPSIYCCFIDITERKKMEAHLYDRNKKLAEIAFLQSHQVRQPIASILGLINLFNFADPTDPINAEILEKVKISAELFDGIITEIVKNTTRIKE